MQLRYSGDDKVIADLPQMPGEFSAEPRLCLVFRQPEVMVKKIDKERDCLGLGAL